MINITLGLLSLFATNFYSLSFKDINGNIVSMQNFQGKKILISNIATGSSKADQLPDFHLLRQQYGDSLVIIVFPSNSFGNEPRSNNEIKQFFDTTFQSNLIIASKCDIIGSDISPIFSWLQYKTHNGEVDNVIQTDFLKFIINNDGSLIGMFSSKIRPTDSTIVASITNTF